MKNTDTPMQRLKQLRKTVAHHRQRYHDDDQPEISDEAYDALLHELQELELAVEGKITTAATVGGAVSAAFAKVTHQVRQWSFDNVFTKEELQEWDSRLKRLITEADQSI